MTSCSLCVWGRGGGGWWGVGGGLGYLVRTSSLQRLMMQESSNRTGNQPRTQTRSIELTVSSCSWSPA